MINYELELEDLEIELLLEAVFRHYGYDFRNYAPASRKRRIWSAVEAEGLTTISGLQEKVLHNRDYLERFLLMLSVNVTSMFRDPSFYLVFRSVAVPLLRTYPFIRIWHAGCSTGEEVYSMAILLQEEGLYDRCRIYATDMNATVLQQAKAGIFPLKQMQDYTQNYQQAGGKRSFSEYYTSGYEHAIFNSLLKQNLIFSQHNLVGDSAFNEFNVIFCRNVLIYFNKILQERVQALFYKSLVRFGILGLGRQESLMVTSYSQHYEELANHEKLYRKIY